jgi:predicted nucleic acid-binding protein
VSTDNVLLDTGPLVAYLNTDDAHHAWACEQFARDSARLVTCEAVLTEAFYLLRRFRPQVAALRVMLADGVFDLTFSLGKERAFVVGLMERYQDVPMSLADACLVRLAELRPSMPVLTLDGDFRIYRRNKRQQIPVIAPR